MALLLLVGRFPASAQTVMPEKAEFARVLRDVLGSIRIGTVSIPDSVTGVKQPPVPTVFSELLSPKRIAVPGAICGMGKVLFSCTWEAAPNKYSVAVLMDDVVAQVSGVLPTTWTREKEQTGVERIAEFVDPSRKVVLTVRCPVSETYLKLDSYTVTLSIQSTAFRR